MNGEIGIEVIGGLAARTAGWGDPVLFVHGFPLDARMWDDQLLRIPDGRRGVAVDLRGFGRSPGTLAESVTMDDHADDLAAVVDALGGDPVDVVGLSMGGYVALSLLERHPGKIRSLVLIDTKASADTDEARAGRDAAIGRLIDEGRAAFVAGMMPALVAPAASRVVRGRLRSMGEATPYETILAALAGMRDRPDRGHVLASADPALTVIVGEHDALTPPEVARAMAGLVDGAVVEVIPGAGHMAPMEAPDEVAEALRRHLDGIAG